jgi:DNA-binding response OmpR family regulator
MSRILIVDDDPHVRQMLERVLRKADHDVETAENGKVALRVHRERPVDLVVTDIIMPEKEGLETITEFRQCFPAVKIVAISGGGRIGPAQYLKMAKVLGANRTFSKPFNPSELTAAVGELLAEPGKE